MTLKQVLSIWTNGRPRSTAAIYESYIETLEAKSQELFSKSLLQVNAGQLTELFRLREEEAKNVTKASHVWILRSFFRTAQRLGACKKNPAIELRPPKFPDKIADRLLTHEQVEALIAAGDTERDRLFIELLYTAGLRVSEACNLTVPDILPGQLRIWGKGEKTAYVRIPKELQDKLLTYAQTHGGHYVFPCYHGKPMTRANAYNIVKKAAAKIGIPKISPHFLRHSHASIALKNGASIVVVKESLRHSSINTTMRYSHVIPGDGASFYLPPIKKP